MCSIRSVHTNASTNFSNTFGNKLTIFKKYLVWCIYQKKNLSVVLQTWTLLHQSTLSWANILHWILRHWCWIVHSKYLFSHLPCNCFKFHVGIYVHLDMYHITTKGLQLAAISVCFYALLDTNIHLLYRFPVEKQAELIILGAYIWIK